MSKTPDWINEVIRDVAELPYRDSPPDQPEMMLVTGDELRDILENARPQIEAEARASMVEQCLNAIRGEYCIDELMDPTDEAYNSALDHAVDAIRALAALPPTHVCVSRDKLEEWRKIMKYNEYEPWRHEMDRRAGEAEREMRDLLAASKGEA